MNKVEDAACPACGNPLEERDGNLWCARDKHAYLKGEVEANAAWRRLGVSQKVEHFRALGAEQTQIKYSLQPGELVQVRQLDFDARSIIKTTKASVTPAKASLVSLAKSVSDSGALSELIDNAIDAGRVKKPGLLISVTINHDPVLRTITIEDDAGGMDREDMRRCFTLGSQKLVMTSNSMGQYGIGAKEAFYHFGREVIVRSRLASSDYGIRTIVGTDWLEDSDWNISIEEGLQDMAPGTTSIQIGKLEVPSLDVEKLMIYLRQTYETLLVRGELSILLNKVPIEHVVEYTQLFPPELFPRTYRMKSGNIDIVVKAMLILKPPEASGLIFYAQDRRFIQLSWQDIRIKSLLRKIQKHNLREHIRAEVYFDGPIKEIPINSTKDDFRVNSVLMTVMRVVSKVTEPYFKAIPIMSRAGGTSVINAFTENHPEAMPAAETVDFGRIGDATPLPANVMADFEKFKVFLQSRLPKDAAEAEDVSDEPIRHKVGEEEKRVLDEPVPAPAGPTSRKGWIPRDVTVRASCSCESESRQSEVELWLRSGRDLGIVIKEEWS